jgi:ABC-type branched-subunit amino acid transport system permease subunit
MEFYAAILVAACIYGIAALADNISFGYSGQFAIAQGAFFGIGAYTWGIGMAHNIPAALVLLMAVAIAAAVGALLAFIARDLRGDYLMIVTLAFQVIAVRLAFNLPDLTGGASGIFGVPAISFGSFQPSDYFQWLAVLVPLVAITFVLYTLFGASRIGLIFKAIREDSDVARSLGRRVVLYRMLALSASAFGISFAGAIYAGYISFIDPSQFTFIFSVLIISILIVGGIANPVGPLVGVLVLTATPELLRLLPGLPADARARLLQVMYAGALLLFIALRPQGLIPEKPGRWSIVSWRWRRTERARSLVPVNEKNA